MSTSQTPGLKKPHHVRTANGTFVAGFDDSVSAAADAARRNKQAKEIDCKADYKVVT